MYDDDNKYNKYDVQRAESIRKSIMWSVIGVIVLVIIISALLFLIPPYKVWRAEMKGKAQLSEAEYSKQVQIQEAQSNLEAEKLNALSEVERAKGAADARQTEGLGMTPEQYVQYLWVKKLSLADSKIIYLPTENGMPALTQPANP